MTPPVRCVGVVVPAHDEQVLLPDALAALQVAARRVRERGRSVDLLVVADACTDGTAAFARAAGVRVREVAARSVGRSRAAGFGDLLAVHAHVPRASLWLASTDADSLVPPGWLLHQVELADRGADLVLGTIDVGDWSEHPTHVQRRWRAAYDRRDGHGHVHGANVGVRAEAYLAAGGFADLEHSEDVALAAALAHRSIVRTGAHPVLTSARTRARAPHGFAAHLLALG